MRLIGLTVVVSLLLAAPAAAAEKQVSALAFSFPPPAPSMDQGDTLVFVNNDGALHNVTAKQNGSDGKPLFASKDVGSGQAKVEGAEFLTTGSYAFECTIHTTMQGTLTVSANGTPAVRPADTTKPRITLAFPSQKLAAIVKAKKVNVRVTVDEPAATLVTVSTRIGSKTVTLGTARTTLKTATTRTVAVKLGSKALKSLSGAKSVKLAAAGQATDTAGNIGRAKTAKLTAA